MLVVDRPQSIKMYVLPKISSISTISVYFAESWTFDGIFSWYSKLIRILVWITIISDDLADLALIYHRPKFANPPLSSTSRTFFSSSIILLYVADIGR